MSDEELAKLGFKDGKFVGYTIGELKKLARFDKIPVMIGNKGVEIFNAETKAGAYKKAVKKHCKDGDVSFMKMTEGVITKEVLPKLKSYEYENVGQTLALFYIANKDPDIGDFIKENGTFNKAGEDLFEMGTPDKQYDLDEFLDKFFVKNKTKKIKEFKKNLFTMMRGAVFYLRFLNDPQVLFCNMEEVIDGVYDMCVYESANEKEGGFIWMDRNNGALNLLKKKNGKLLPIPTYDRKKIAADPEYKQKFLNVFQPMAYGAGFTQTEEAKKLFDEFERHSKGLEDIDDEEPKPKPKPKPEQKARDPSKRLTKAEKEYLKDNPKVVFMGTEKDTGSDTISTISYEFKGKDYELEEDTGAVYREDEDGEYELVGYRRVKEIEIVKNGKKKIKKEVYIVEPYKARDEAREGLVHPFLNQEALDLRRELTDEEKIEKLEEQVKKLQEKNDELFDELSEEIDEKETQFQRASELEERLNEVEDRKKELEEELREAITATPVEVPTEPTSEFADVSKLLKEIADLTEAREKEKGEIVKVKSLEIQIEKLNRMLDNAIEEREEFATTAYELEEKLRGQKDEEKEEDDEDEDLKEDYDILKMILVSLDVDIDALLEAVKEEDDFFDFFESPGYARIVLRPVLMEIEDKDFNREETDDEDD
jgi:hypothetical protein